LPRKELQLEGELLKEISNVLESEGLSGKLIAVQQEGGADILFLNARTKKPILPVELKDPSAPDGRSVYYYKTYEREFKRAKKLGCNQFAITNFLEAVVFNPSCPTYECDEWILREGRALNRWQVERYKRTLKVDGDLRKGLRNLAEFFVEKAYQVLEKSFPAPEPVDEKFIYKVQSLLKGFVGDLASELYERSRKDGKFRRKLYGWVREQLWTLPTEFEGYERIANLALLILFSKLIFYKALYDHKVYPSLPKLHVPETVKTGEELRTYLWKEYFEVLLRVTGDFENIIGKEGDFINVVPFLADSTLELVKSLVLAEEKYDFSKLPHDIVGRVFEKLIMEEERHKLGQYFTPTLVVDLINAFCIRTGDEKVLDPTCGSGSFLVRAYDRKKRLTYKNHPKLIEEIWGFDISEYAVQLATLNLAIRDFRYIAYPNVFCKDFFDVWKGSKLKKPGISDEVLIEEFDAVVGNPPYTRQEEIDDLIHSEKEKIYAVVERDGVKGFSKRSSIYAYVFFHSGVFLKEGGYLGFITSNSFLDTDYGKYLKKWMLENFRIVAIIDSKVERFFEDADVNTAVTILQKREDKEEREKNFVRFVYLKRKLSEVIEKFNGVDGLREFIEKTDSFYEDEFLKVKPVRQKELSPEEKWGVFLKAGKVYWEILSKTKGKWKKLSEVAEVRFGIKTGLNDFFYFEDFTDRPNGENLFLAAVNRTGDLSGLEDAVSKGLRLVKNGFGEMWLIEEELLYPIVKSPREIKGYFVRLEDLKHKVLLFGFKEKFTDEEGRVNLKAYEKWVSESFPYAYTYVKYGERRGYHRRKTLQGRKPWWDLGEGISGCLAHFMIHFKRFFVPFNEGMVLLDHNLFAVKPKNADDCIDMGIFLNSSLHTYQVLLLGRGNLGEGSLKTEGMDIKNFSVPAVRVSDKNRLLDILKRLKPESLMQELRNGCGQRMEVDKAVLLSLGFPEDEIVLLLPKLYSELLDLINSRLEKAKSVGKRKRRKQDNMAALLEEFQKIVEEKGISLKNDFWTAKTLFELAGKVTSSKKLKERIVSEFWKNTFGEALNLDKLKGEVQGTFI